ncbi:MAG: phosphate acyltransferase [Aestuariivita sp.]|nr:phosphate acyltransferase [Aestuariivita sp.]MCY4203489.1 phosphate acyltransferase [Aestuariivita sp.]
MKTLFPSQLLKQTKPERRATIVMSEGSDPRIVLGSLAACREGVAEIILVGSRKEIFTELNHAGGNQVSGIRIEDPSDSPQIPKFVSVFNQLRGNKEQLTEEIVQQKVRDPLIFSALLVRTGQASGTVGGAVSTSSRILRTAITILGKATDAPFVSSVFLMYPPANALPGARAMVYADCGLLPDPNAEQLAQIAKQAANAFSVLMCDTPRVAMLSFSTKGSARHAHVNKVIEATNQLKETMPELLVDGELQFDTAFAPDVGERKTSGSDVAGQANVMIFPNLDAGNICYKITQHLGGYTAVGPVLQGLAKPANDLSRGCTAAEVKEIIAVTVLQARHGLSM